MSVSSNVSRSVFFLRQSSSRVARVIAIMSAVLAGLALPGAGAAAQVQATVMKGSVAGSVHRAVDAGRLDGGTRMSNMTMHFARTEEQKAELASLLKEQQDRSSPLFHKWLTAAEFKSRFGADASVSERAASWLTSQGFAVQEVTPLQVRFSGSAAQVETAFKTQMRQYSMGNVTFYANAKEIALPASLSGVVLGIENLNSLRPMPQHRAKKSASLHPNFTDGAGDHFTVPADVQTIYDVNAIYAAGYTGAGQTIVVVGQSAIDPANIASFRSVFGGSTNLIQTLMPYTGDSVKFDDDEEESDLDIEYSGAMAKDATVNFVYAGADDSLGAFDALQYAIQNNLAPIISVSYGQCEANLDSFTQFIVSNALDEASAQGQSVIVAAGDAGATACDQSPYIYVASSGLQVQFPSDSPDVTGIGGTEFNEGSGDYWSTTDSTYLGSALSYIPEMVWNDSTGQSPLAAGGGGASTLFTKPDWQVGVGVPADGARDIPDISLDASGVHDPYFFCGEPDINGNNCDNGYVYESGGTSFGAPIFAGILTLINQSSGGVGLGNIDSLIYPMVTTNATAFHDITVGNNDSPCQDGSTDCPSGVDEEGYSAGTGYDLASGLGSIDAFLFAEAFPGYGTGTALVGSSVALSYTPTAPNAGSNVTFTATVSSNTSGSPTGSIQFVVDGNATGDPTPLVGESATYVSPPLSLSAGVHIITAEYSGDATFGSSAASISLSVAALPATSLVISFTPTSPTTATPLNLVAKIASGAAGTITGTIDFSVDGNDTNNPLTISGGTVALTVPALTAGAHVITAQYSGDDNYAPSSGLTAFNVSAVSTTTIKLSVTPSAPSVTDTVVATAALPSSATGSVQFLVDGVANGAPAAVGGGTATASLGTLSAGSHTIEADYAGDGAFAPASVTLPVVVSSTAAAFTLSATGVTLTQNQSGDSTVTVTSTSDYAGTVNLAVTGTGPEGVCFLVNGNPTVGAHASASALIAIYTGTGCSAQSNARHVVATGGKPLTPGRSRPFTSLALAGVAGLFLFGFKRRTYALKLMSWIILLGAFGAVVGCSGSGSSSSGTSSQTGTYTLTVTGTDSASPSNTSSTTFTLVVQ